MELRGRGVQPSSINTWLRGLKAYLLLRKEQGHEVFKVQFLKTEQKILATLSSVQITSLLQWRPEGVSVNLRRAYTIAVPNSAVPEPTTLLLCGLRCAAFLLVRRRVRA